MYADHVQTHAVMQSLTMVGWEARLQQDQQANHFLNNTVSKQLSINTLTGSMESRRSYQHNQKARHTIYYTMRNLTVGLNMEGHDGFNFAEHIRLLE